MSAPFDAQVARGIELLDERVPGWRERINLDRLVISSCEDCVLGQVFGDYFDGRSVLGRNVGPGFWFDWATDHGFTAETISGFDELAKAWKHALGEVER